MTGSNFWMEGFAEYVADNLPFEPYEWRPVCIGYCHALRIKPKAKDKYLKFLKAVLNIDYNLGTEAGLQALQKCFRAYWKRAVEASDLEVLNRLATFVIYRWGHLGNDEEQAFKRSEKLIKHFDLKENRLKLEELRSRNRVDLVALSKLAAWINPVYQIYDSRVSFALNVLYEKFKKNHSGDSRFPETLPLPLASRRGSWPEEFKNCRKLIKNDIDCSFYNQYLVLLKKIADKSKRDSFNNSAKVERALFMYGKKELVKYSKKVK